MNDRAAALPGRPAYLAVLPDFLFVPDDNKARYVAKAWVLSLLPSVALAVAASLLIPHAAPPPVEIGGTAMFLFVLILGPFLETLLMMAPLLLLNRFAGPGPAVIGSAILWAIAHGVQAPIWGLVIWWPFLVFSIAFLTWREKGLPTAIMMVTIIHGLQNSLPAALVLLTGSPAEA